MSFKRIHLSGKGIHGFTLLEVMVSLSIIAIALTVLLSSQSQSLSLASESKFNTTAALLAQGKMAEMEALKTEDLRSDSGDFGDAFPDYHWEMEVTRSPFLGTDHFSDFLDRIDLNVYFGEQRLYQYHLRLYRFAPREE
jgi:general secretion pathway protein I